MQCAYHDNQSLTNFCKSQQCFLPLCPKCIQLHVSEHYKDKSLPIIQRQITFISINYCIYQITQTVKNIDILLGTTMEEIQQEAQLKAYMVQQIWKRWQDVSSRVKRSVNNNLMKIQKNLQREIKKFNQFIYQKTQNLLQESNQLHNQLLLTQKNFQQNPIINLIKFHSNKTLQQIDNHYQQIQYKKQQLFKNNNLQSFFSQQHLNNICQNIGKVWLMKWINQQQ